MSRLMIVEVPSYSCEFKGIREICELVRCGECERRKYTSDKNKALYCDKYKKWMTADDFCSYGVKGESK